MPVFLSHSLYLSRSLVFYFVWRVFFFIIIILFCTLCCVYVRCSPISFKRVYSCLKCMSNRLLLPIICLFYIYTYCATRHIVCSARTVCVCFLIRIRRRYLMWLSWLVGSCIVTQYHSIRSSDFPSFLYFLFASPVFLLNFDLYFSLLLLSSVFSSFPF